MKLNVPSYHQKSQSISFESLWPVLSSVFYDFQIVNELHNIAIQNKSICAHGDAETGIVNRIKLYSQDYDNNLPKCVCRSKCR